MSEVNPALDPVLVERLPERARRLLETRVPGAPTPEFNRGVRSGLTFAAELLRALDAPAELALKALQAAVDLTTARLAPQEQEEIREAYARYRREFTAADLARYAEEEEMFPLDDLIRELEAIHRQENSEGQDNGSVGRP